MPSKYFALLREHLDSWNLIDLLTIVEPEIQLWYKLY